MHLAFLPNHEMDGDAGGGPRWRPACRSGNPFHERSLVEAAAQFLAAPGERVHLLGDETASWDSLLPLKLHLDTPYGSVWSVWSHIHAMDTTPGTIHDHAPLLNSLFGFLRERRARILRWSTLPADTSFYDTLIDWLEDNGLDYCVTKRIERPVLSADAGDARARVEASVGGKRQREFRRSRRRLEERGPLVLRTHDGPHDSAAWLSDFLDIERSGWKGRAGTALACRQEERAWFDAMAHRAAAQGRVLVYRLDLGGEAVAMSVNLRAGRRVWCFKTAYRDDLARFAPGALLEYESTFAAIDDPTIGWLDACTMDAGGLMGTLWPERRPVVDMLIATRRGSNSLVRAAALGWRGYLAGKRRGTGLAARLRSGGQRGRP